MEGLFRVQVPCHILRAGWLRLVTSLWENGKSVLRREDLKFEGLEKK